MKDQIEKTCTEKRKAEDFRSTLWVRIVCIVLLITLIACLSCALWQIFQLKKQAAFLNGSVAKIEKIRIYIDQGHNPAPYHNSGAVGNGLYEQDLTFSIGCILAEMLRKDGRFEVCLSRPQESTVLGTDNKSSLQARVDGAVDFEADYFISLHINSFSQNNANGIEVFAAEDGTESYVFGKSLLQGLLNSTSLKNRGMKMNPDLYVLKNASMPAVLVEMGFISNNEDAALLSEHPELFAQGIYDGIVDYFDPFYVLDMNVLIVMICLLSIILIIAGFLIIRKYMSKQSETGRMEDEKENLFENGAEPFR